ncbi:MAG: hypothetical protein NUV32_01055 [Exilispira sp.]|jgi:hypothetical protein|nr:hypothetical protein [Exilispira sp.]
MELKITSMEAKLIKKWFEQETVGHFGDGDFTIGEEQSILDKIKIDPQSDVDYVLCNFNLTELEILNIWSARAFGIYEEKALKDKIKLALEEEKNQFLARLKARNQL